MAEENKNQDPEEDKNLSGNDDDFGLPDFEFEALDDDDDDSSEASPSTPKQEPAAEEEVPSMDDGDLEGLDLEGLEDIDIGDLDDIDLDNLDLDNLDDLDLDNLDSDLGLEDSPAKKETEKPVAASADKDEDIFDTPEASTDDEIAESLGFEDDGTLYQEESYEDFDMGDIGEMAEGSSIFDEGDDAFDSSIFDADDAAGFEESGQESEEPVPFAKREMPKSHAEEHVEEEVVSEADIRASKGKFVRIVVLGTIMFVTIGVVFLYFYRNQGEPTEKPPVAERAEKEPVKEEPTQTPANSESEETAKPTDTKAEEPVKETPKQPAKTETKKPATQPKQQTAQPKTQPKQTTTTRPTGTTVGGVTVLSERTGQRHLIVASFLDGESAQQHARTLAAKGDSPKIIPPFGDSPNYRVAIQSYSTLNEALQNLEAYRAQYGGGVWVLRY